MTYKRLKYFLILDTWSGKFELVKRNHALEDAIKKFKYFL